MASRLEGPTGGLTFVAAGAKVGPGSHFWIEESPTGPKGNLYIIAEGTARETAGAARGLRDQFYGESGRLGAPVELRGALVAANDYLLRQAGIGVAILSATTFGGDQVAMARLGDGQAYLYSPQRGSLEALFPATVPSSSLGTQSNPEIQQVTRRLRGGDRLLLGSAPLVEALDEAEVATRLATVPQEEEAVRRLVESASTSGGRASGDMVALLISAQPASGGPAQISVESLWLEDRPALQEEPLPEATASGVAGVSEGRRARLPGWAVAVLGGLGLLLLVYWGWGRLPFSEGSPTPVPRPAGAALPLEEPTPAPGVTPNPTPATSAALRRRIDLLWPEGDRGNVAALQEIVALLEELQAQTLDPSVEEKLAVARVNLAYRQKMEEVASLWRDETAAATTSSWSRAVELLEALYTQKLPPAYQGAVRAKLYAAHINYGRALVAGGRTYEAQGQFQRAIQIDDSRPEAVDALRRLR